MAAIASRPLRAPRSSRLVEENVPVTFAQKLVGHARVETTTGHYLRLRGGDEEQLEALRSVL
jgi:hypothetical protein